DLIRTFFEMLALWSFIEWTQTARWKHFFVSAIMIGLAITTKVLAIGSLLVFSLLIIYVYYNGSFKNKGNLFSVKNTSVKIIVSLLIFWFIALFIPLPWFIFSYSHTGNPVYPFFTKHYPIAPNHFNPLEFVITLWNLFMYSPDPISPLYLIFLPLIFITFTTFQKEIKLIVWYSVISLLLWYFTPQTGGGRFILPYLPVFSFVCGAIYSEILKKTGKEWGNVSLVLSAAVVFVFVISIGYRFIANSKYIPVLIGKESQSQFLSSHLNFSYGDFYDTDGYFISHIKSSDTVLLYGFHNLYYIDFPFIDSSWVRKGESFDYIATQKTHLPTRFKDWQLIYMNDTSMVQLYKPPKGECHRICHY
ncbi:MAG TPA: hypothetical protein VN704_05480, partial [Verrucomicrobiae bacterium]|nr:hypothetical protein [Verrucomicrobiae bacterium]